MKLLICITDRKYSAHLIQELNHNGYRVTKLASTGSFFRKGNDTLLIGIGNEQIAHLQQLMKETVTAYEKKKGISNSGNRYTTFIVSGHNFLPLLQEK